ncbi:unnamed protein product [Agarophyton chilense]
MQHANCQDHFGAVWPDSVGKADSALSGCSKEEEIGGSSTGTGSSFSDNDNQIDEASSTATPSITASLGEMPPTAMSNATSNSDLNTTNATESGGSESKDEGKDQSGGLSGLEISGIVAGLVGTLVAIIGLGLEVKKRRVKAPNVKAIAELDFGEHGEKL